MRNIFVLGLLMMAIALCINGEGSGGDVVVITPTNKSAPPTDATNDSGSGVDDEDGDDDGSTTDAPTQMATTVVTTTMRKATTTIAATTRVGDDEEEGSGGSASGATTTVMTYTDSSVPYTDSTDIYISESTTEMATDPPKTKLQSTMKSTQGLPTTGSIVVDDTTTKTPAPKAQSTTASVKTVGSQDVSTGKPTVKPTTKSTTKSQSTTNSNVVRDTTETPTQRRTVKIKTDNQKSTTKTEYKTKEPATVMPKTKQRPSTPRLKESTTAKDVINALASHGKKSGEGFTLTTEVIAGVVGCALLALLFIAFLMYRLKKRDEGSYLLDDSCGHLDAYKKVDTSDKEAFV